MGASSPSLGLALAIRLCSSEASSSGWPDSWLPGGISVSSSWLSLHSGTLVEAGLPPLLYWGVTAVGSRPPDTSLFGAKMRGIVQESGDKTVAWVVFSLNSCSNQLKEVRWMGTVWALTLCSFLTWICHYGSWNTCRAGCISVRDTHRLWCLSLRGCPALLKCQKTTNHGITDLHLPYWFCYLINYQYLSLSHIWNGILKYPSISHLLHGCKKSQRVCIDSAVERYKATLD